MRIPHLAVLCLMPLASLECQSPPGVPHLPRQLGASGPLTLQANREGAISSLPGIDLF